nr:ATP-binding protein [uncultured Desulfobacter sp.]
MTVSSYKRMIRLGILPKVVIFVTTLIILHFLLLYLSVSEKLEETNAQIIQRAESLGESYLLSEKLISQVAINDCIKGLDKKSTQAIELRTQELAFRLADFLYERDQDVLQLSVITPDPKKFLAVYRTQKRDVIIPGPWPREIKESAPSPIAWKNDNNRTLWQNRPAFGFNTVQKPLYKEITFVDLKGHEQIKITDGAVSSDLRDVSKKENTHCRAEDYFTHLGRLKQGEIYVSRMVGAYVPGVIDHTQDSEVKIDPENAYAGKENPNGKPFEGIVRWATPVYDVKGQKTGYVTMALDHVHIMEFADHVVPTDQWFSDIPDAGSGNYASLWDNEARCISHPRDFFICGYDPKTGQAVPGWLSQSTYEEYKKSGRSLSDFVKNLPPFRDFSFSKNPASVQALSGNIPLDCKVLDFAPQCEGRYRGAAEGGSGSFLVFWSGLWKLTTYAAIPYYTGRYGESRRGFGYVVIDSQVADFHQDAMVSKANLEEDIAQEMASIKAYNKETWRMIQGFTRKNKQILFLSTAVLDLMTLLVLSFFIFRMLKPLNQVTNVAEAIQQGDLDQHIEVNSSDEIGRLAYAFNKMAEFLSKADKLKAGLMADQVETNKKLTREIEVRRKAEDALQKAHLELEHRVEERTAELKQSNEDLKKAKAMAEDASKAKGAFLANMSHEIRTPLNGIIGMAELALDGDLTPRDRNTIQVVSSEADSLLRIVNDILDFSKIEAGMLELESIPFNLRVLVEDLSTGIAWQAEQKSLEVITYISNDVPNRVEGDPGRLRQILLNLSGNALKFTHEGEIFLQVELASIKGNQVEIRFAVTDTGIGIPPDKQHSIFESFTQADGSTTRKYGGTGLGITISKQLVELMGGKLMLTSIEGKGSTFCFNM